MCPTEARRSNSALALGQTHYQDARKRSGHRGHPLSTHPARRRKSVGDTLRCLSSNRVKETSREGGKPADSGTLKNMSTPRRQGRSYATQLSCVALVSVFYIKGPVASRADRSTRAVCTGQALGWSTARAASPPSRQPDAEAECLPLRGVFLKAEEGRGGAGGPK